MSSKVPSNALENFNYANTCKISPLMKKVLEMNPGFEKKIQSDINKIIKEIEKSYRKLQRSGASGNPNDWFDVYPQKDSTEWKRFQESFKNEYVQLGKIKKNNPFFRSFGYCERVRDERNYF